MKSRKNEKADSRNNTNSWRNNNNKTTNQQTDEIEALTNKKTEEPIQKSQFANNNLQDNEVESISGDTSINSSLNAIQRKTLESDDAKMMRAIQRKTLESDDAKMMQAIQRKTLESDDAKMMRAIQRKTLESDDAKMMRAIQRKTLESDDAKMMRAIQRKTLESDDAKMMQAIQRKTLEDKYPIQAKFTDNTLESKAKDKSKNEGNKYLYNNNDFDNGGIRKSVINNKDGSRSVYFFITLKVKNSANLSEKELKINIQVAAQSIEKKISGYDKKTKTKYSSISTLRT